MEFNYIAVYRSGRDYFPISIFVQGNGTYPHNIYCKDDLVDLLLEYECPADNAIACKKTILDYDSYLEDRENIINGLLKILDGQD